MADAPALGAGAAKAAWRFDPSLAYHGRVDPRGRTPPPARQRLAAGLPRILAGRCRSPPPPAPSPRSCSRSSSRPSGSSRAIDDAVRRLSRADARRRLPAGQGPATGPRAPSRPGRRPRRGGRAPGPGRLPRGPDRAGHPAADQRRCRDRPGRGGQAAHLQGDRPGPARGRARRLQHFNFGPEIETIDDARVDKVLEELRDQNATLTAVEGRGAQDGDYAVISFDGIARRRAVRGRHARSGCR